MPMHVGQDQQPNIGNFQMGTTVQVSAVNAPPVGFDPRIKDTLNKANATQTQNQQQTSTDPNRPILPTPTQDPLSSLQSLITAFKQLNPNKTNTSDKTSDNGQGEALTPDDQRAAYAYDFNNELTAYAQQNNLSESDVAQLRFAFYNPDAKVSGKLSDGSDLNQILKTVTDKAQGDTKADGIDISKLNPQVDNKAFNLNISDAYNAAFEAAVNADPSLSPDEKAALIYQHYNPSPTVPGVNQKALQQFEKAALQTITKQNGIPPGWSPALNNEMYNAALNGGFQVNLQMNLDDYSSSNHLTDQQIASLKVAIQDPNNPGLSPDIKAMAQAIMAKTISDTKTDSNLPVNWQPSAEQMKNVFADISNNMVTTSLVQIQEMLRTATTQVSLLMPDGPAKQHTMDLLMTISRAIVEARSTIYELQMANSETAKQQTAAKLGMQEQQIREQKDQNDAVAKQIAKQQSMGDAMKVLGPIMKIFEVILNILTGGLFGAIFGALDSQFQIVSKAITAIVKGVCDLVDKMIPDNSNPDLMRFKEGLKAFLQLVVMVLIIAVAGPALMALGPMQFVNIIVKMFTESDIIKNFCLMCGIPKEAVQWVVMAMVMAITIAIAVLSCINPANAIPMITNAVAKIAEGVMKVVQKVMAIIEKVMDFIKNIKILNKIIEFVEDVGKSAKKVVEAVIDKVKEITEKIMDKVKSTFTKIFEKLMTKLEESKSLDKLASFVKNTAEKVTSKDHEFLGDVLKYVGVAQAVTSAAASGIRGGMNLSMAKIADTKGQHEAAIAELEAMVKMLQKILNSILEGLSGINDQLNDLKGLHDNLLAGLQQTLQKTTSIQIT